MQRYQSLLALFVAAVASCAAQTPSVPCAMPPAVRQALNDLPNAWDYSVPFEERMKPLRALLQKYPSDLSVHLRYQDAFRSYWLYQEYDAAFAMYRSKPADPLYRYLEARLTARFDRLRAEEMLNRLLTDRPDSAWAHFGIAEITDAAGARDAKKAEAHLRDFLAACPQSVDGYAMLRTVEDPEMIRDGAAKLRPLMEAQRDSVSLPYWRYLWDLEFRATPKEEQETVRRRALADAELMKRIPHAPSRDWYYAFDRAATLTNDQALREWLESTVLKEFPGSLIAVNVERTQWSREHPRPGRDARPEAMEAFAKLDAAHQEDLARRHPDDYNVILDRWMYVGGSGAGRPLAEKLAIADAYIGLLSRSPDASFSAPPPSITLADHYNNWQVRLDQVPELVSAGLRQAELQQKYAPVASMAPAAMQGQMSDALGLVYWRAYLVLADYYLSQRKLDDARDAIQAGLLNVERRPLFPLDSARGKSDAAYRRSTWYVRQARLAVMEGDGKAALAFYQCFLTGQGRDIVANTGPAVAGRETQDVITEAKKLYLARGGNEASWLDWATSAPGAERTAVPVEYKTPLPAFEAKDLSGRTWRLADLKGKATYIDVWATWCGPCRAEHPELQKLYETVQSRKDIQVLTFSVDDTAYAAESYMKDKKYGFPVIASKDLAEKLLPMAGYPQHWIIDAAGRRSGPVGFASIDAAIRELERAAAAK